MLRFFIYFSVCAITLLTALPALAADVLGGEVIGGTAPAEEPTAGQEETKERDSAKMTQPIYPGVINKVISKGGNGTPETLLNYPVFKNGKVNSAILAFVKEMAADFEEDIRIEAGEEKPSSYEMWESHGSYVLEYANPDVVTVVFSIYSYSGGAHGMLLLRCLNFNLQTGEEFAFDTIFGDPEKALGILSELSITRLRAELGDEADEDMISYGASPEKSNFNNLILRHDGVAVQFQPYQVAPWAAGPQTVQIDLKELSPAKPNPEIWPDTKNEKK
ncbi:MAG: DUF3298 and DUF4163 domain-containing protein [Desulfovibrio sp.]|nr:DUF3298 and DUF4163 domain-containing protein [Desulfovibrio sp.]